jgi:DNA polymerase
MEDKLGEGFVGVAGKTLDKMLAAAGIERAAYGRANICRCRPPGNRKPLATEANACLPYLHEAVASPLVKVVLAVGGTPASEFYEGGSLTAILERAAERQYVPDASWASHLKVVPMPHTSPLAWHRKAPSGERWADVGTRQIAVAVELLNAGAAVRDIVRNK